MGPKNPSNVFVKIGITALSGGCAYLLTALARQPVIWSLTMSIFIGGVFLVVQFLIDFERRLIRLEAAEEQRFVRFNKATALLGLIEASPLQTDSLVELIEQTSLITSKSSRLVTAFADRELKRTITAFARLAGIQRATQESEHFDWMFTLVSAVAETIAATSVTGPPEANLPDSGFWRSTVATAYLRRQQEAMERGVKVRRLFIAATPQTVTDLEFRQAIEKNVGYGIEVRWLDHLPADHEIETIDFILFDDQISYEFPYRSSGSELNVDPATLQKRIGQFNAWWQAAATPEQLPSLLAEARRGQS